MEPPAVVATLFMRFQENVSRALERNFQNSSTIAQKGRAKKATLSRNEMVNDSIDKAIWVNFPRKASFYEPAILSFAKLANTSLETAVQLFLFWLPLHSQAYAQMHDLTERVNYPIIEIYGYDHFLAKLKNFEAYDQRQSDLAECVVDLIVADTLYACLQFFKGDNLSSSVVSKLLELCFYNFKPRDPKWAMHAPLWYTMRTTITQQWCSILYVLTSCHCPHVDRNELLKNALAATNNDEQAAYLKGLRWVMLDTSTKTGITQSETFIDSLLTAIDDKKRTNKPLLLEVLDSVLESVDFSESLDGIATRAKDIFKRAAKWLKIDELGYTAKKLMGTVLSRGPSTLFEAEIDTFLNKKVLKGVWSSNIRKRDSNLETLLRLLRGKHMSERTSWLPKTDGLFPPVPLPYSHVGFASNPAKMVERLKNIVLGLFSKKTPIIKSMEGFDICVDIVVQIAAHSMTLTREFLLPMLLSERNNILIHQLIGLRAIRVIFDLSSGFWPEAPWNNTVVKLAQCGYARHEHVVPREELEKIFETTLMKLLVAAESSAGFAVYGRDGNHLKVTTSMKPSDIVLRELDINEESPTHKILSETTKQSINRWYEIVMKSSEKREKDLADKLNNADKRVTDTVRIWCSHSLVPTRGLVDTSVESKPEDYLRRKKSSLALNQEKSISLEMYKEAVRCIPLILPEDVVRLFSGSSFFGQLIVHNDNELATICSHSLQKIMIDHPKHRLPILKGMIALVQQYPYEEALGLNVVLNQLLSLIDLWNYLKYDTAHAKVDAYNDPDQSVIDEAYAVAMVHLCHPDCEIRYLSFQIMRAINALKPSLTNPSFTTLIELHDSSIIEQARFKFLLNGSHGIDSVRVYDGQSSKSITVMEAVMTQQLTFWAYVISEIGKCLVDNGAHLAVLRENLLVRLNSLPTAPIDVNNEAAFNTDYRIVRRNYAASLFSISSPATNEFQNRDFLQWQAKFIESLTSLKASGYLSALLSDVDWARDGIIIACGGCHWHGFDVIINGLNNWYSNLKKREKPKVKPWVASILRQLSQDHDFSKALHKFVGICAVYLQFINEMESVFSNLMKVGNEYYFVDSILVIKNFCNAIYKPNHCTSRGPIRLYLTPSSPPELEWSDGERYRLFKLLLLWFYDVQKDEYQQEVTKSLAKIKEQVKRDEKKKEHDRAVRDITNCIRSVVESMAKVGSIFPDDQRGTIKDYLEFFVAAEQKGHSINRWLLSFHYPDALSVFVDQAYARPAEESPLFINAIFDQYLPIADSKPPSNGITAQLQDYYTTLGREAAEAQKAESNPLTVDDEIFTQQTLHNAGTLLHLALFNTIHANVGIRSRSVDLLARLVPNKFGAEQHLHDSAVTAELRTRLEFYKGLAPQVLPKARPNALEISQTTAKSVSTLTESVFKEAVLRLVGKGMPFGGKKWIIDFLLPWCENILLGAKTNFKTYTTETFLDAIYTNFLLDMVVDDQVPSTLVIFWQALAQVSTDNLLVIINYLLRKATVSAKHLGICKAVILHIYRKDAPPTLLPLLSHFNISNLGDELNEDEAGKKNRENFQLREAAIIVLYDLITDNVQPLIPHLHVLLTYTLLKGNSTESKSLSRLLIAITNALYNLLLARRDQETLLSAIKALSSCMDLANFRIKWNYSKYSKESTWSSKEIDTNLATGVAETVEAAEIAQWYGQPVEANKVILLFCDCLQQIAPELLEKWAKSSLDHAVSHKDPQLAIMAHQMYRAIGSTVDQECINKLLSSLLDSVERMESILEKTITLAKNPKQTASKRFQTNETLISIYRGKSLEVLLTLQTITPAVVEITTLRLIFWTAVTFLRSPVPPFAQLYHQALQLVTILNERDFFSRYDPANFDSTAQILSKIQITPFKGIQPLLFQGLSSRSMAAYAAPLIAALIKVPHNNMIHASPTRYGLTIAGLLPWLHSGISSTISIDSLYLDTCITVCENMEGKLPQTAQVLKAIINNGYATNPDGILQPICEDLHRQCLPTYADALAEVLCNTFRNNSKFLSSVLHITKILLSFDNAVEYVTAFQDIIKAATEKLLSLRIATDVILIATNLLQKKFPDSTLHAKIKPLSALQQPPIVVKYSSMVIRQLMSTTGNMLPPPVSGPTKRAVTPRGAKPTSSYIKGSISHPGPTVTASGSPVQAATSSSSNEIHSVPKVVPKVVPRVVTPSQEQHHDRTASIDNGSSRHDDLSSQNDESEADDYDEEESDSDAQINVRRFNMPSDDELRNLAADLDLPSDFNGLEFGDDANYLGDVTANLDVNNSELSSALSVLEKYM